MKMSNEEWQEKYTKMSIFYQDRLKYTEEMLAKAMEMNLKLIGMLQDSRADYKFGPGFSDPLKTLKPFDGRAAGQGCMVCGLSGMNGYVCHNTACPSKVTCNSSTMPTF
jgi:hypothetical protein